MSFILVSDKSNYGCIDYLRFIRRFFLKFKELIQYRKSEHTFCQVPLGIKEANAN